MAVGIDSIFEQLAQVVGVCPCCGDLFYLSEARPYRVGKQVHSIVDSLREMERRLEREEEKLEELETVLREKAAASGLRAAKKLLKRIDPVFSGSGYDPHDVKVIFDPVTYVVFNGMSRGKLRDISLIAKPPESSEVERRLMSIDRTIRQGNVEFRTLRVGDDGIVSEQ